MVLDSICGLAGGPIWDWNMTWNTETPTLTECFKDTVPYWIPCGIFFILFPLEYFQLKSLSLHICPWRPRDYARILLLCLLSSAVLARLVGKSVLWFTKNTEWFAAGEISYCLLLITLLLIIYTTYCRQKRVYTGSGVSWLTVFALCVFGSLQCATSVQLLVVKPIHTMPGWDIFDSVLYLMFYILLFLNLLLLSVSSIGNDYLALQNENDQPSWPEQFCSFPSQLFFSWVKSLIHLGYKKSLTLKDVWFVHPDDQTATVCSYFAKAVDKEYSDAVAEKCYPKDKIDSIKFVKPKSRPFLLKVLLKSFGLSRIITIILLMTAYVGACFAEPVFVGLITRYAQNFSKEPAWHGYVYVLLALGFFIKELIYQQSFFTAIRSGIRIRSGLMSIIYRKALRLSPEARKQTSIGEIVNLMSIDADRCRSTVSTLHDLLPAPLLLILAYFYLYQLVGVAAFSGLAVAVTICLSNFFLIKLCKKWQTAEMSLKDKRLKIISEIINGIKVLKFYAWEAAFQKKVENIRWEELMNKKNASYLGGFFDVVFHCTVLLCSLATFAAFVLINPDKPLTPEIVFVSLTIFNMINIASQNLPNALVTIINTKVSYNRLHDFLSNQELPCKNVNLDLRKEYDVDMDNASFAWDVNIPEPVLKNINMQILNRKLVAVIGQVGCGKSSLLSALCGEMFCTNGSYNIKDSIAFVSQQAWIQNMTLKDNILFNKEIDSVLYNKILDSCDLRPDLEVLPSGDLTEIGERGINLSGGQKMRISLARAVYQDKDIYLLDDPLAAVDVHVGRKIFDEVLGPKGLLAAKTRIMVTHGLTYLPQCDLIIVMKNGTVDRVGTFQELKNSNGAFSEFLIHYFEEANEEELEEIVEDIELKTLSNDETITSVLRKRRLSHQTSASSREVDFQRLLSVPTDDEILLKRDNSEKIRLIDSDKHKLISDENVDVGGVRWSTYLAYVTLAGFGIFAYTFVIFASKILQLMSTFWLQKWTDNSHVSSTNITSDVITWDVGLRNYALFGFGQILFTSILGICLAQFQIRAAKNIHDKLIESLLKAPMSFFDTTPTGRTKKFLMVPSGLLLDFSLHWIVNRCGHDINAIDSSVPELLGQFWDFFIQTVRNVAAILIIAPYFILALIPGTIGYIFFQRFFVNSSRQLRRLEAVTRSPIYCHFQESLQGVSTIRAFRQGEKFTSQFERLIDVNSSMELARLLTNRWSAIYLNLAGSLLISIFVWTIVCMIQQGMSAGLVGLSMTYAMTFTANLLWGVRLFGMLESEMVAVERVKEYTETSLEAPWENLSCRPPLSWPDKGCINFVDYSTRYRPGLPLVLEYLTIRIKSGQKIGVIGRTGAGKSSMTLALFRLIERTNGKIVIDGIDISQLGLHDLRKNMTIIPQDPIIFSGSLRSNIDPFENFSNDEIWQVLEMCHLRSFVFSLPERLEHDISEGGGNLSVGQRQLICLARALLRKSKILILDEATASVDVETDAFVQETIRERCKDCTVITIAHRLNTVMDSDKILVLDNGQVAEFDSSNALIQQPNSLFHKMIQRMSNLQ